MLCDTALLDGSSQDLLEARAFAAIVCEPAAVDSFLNYVRAQAVALINANRTVVLAIAAALFEHGELSGHQID